MTLLVEERRADLFGSVVITVRGGCTINESRRFLCLCLFVFGDTVTAAASAAAAAGLR